MAVFQFLSLNATVRIGSASCANSWSISGARATATGIPGWIKSKDRGVTLSSATSNCTCLNTANFPSGDDETCLGATALTFPLSGALLVVGDGVGIGGRGECVASYLHDRAYVIVVRAVWVEVLGVEVNVFNLGDIHAVVAAEV